MKSHDKKKPKVMESTQRLTSTDDPQLDARLDELTIEGLVAIFVILQLTYKHKTLRHKIELRIAEQVLKYTDRQTLEDEIRIEPQSLNIMWWFDLLEGLKYEKASYLDKKI